jgi:hypothetical protein
VAGGGLDSAGSGQGPLASCYECGDQPSVSCTTQSVSQSVRPSYRINYVFVLKPSWYYKIHTAFKNSPE